MKKKIIVLIIAMLMILPVTVYAYGGIDTDITIDKTEATVSSVEVTNRIVGILQVVGTIISIAALVIIGIRYMISSVEEKAQLKGILGYYVIGAVLVFATSNVLTFAYVSIRDVGGEDYSSDGCTWTSWNVTKPATCTKQGEKTRTCVIHR